MAKLHPAVGSELLLSLTVSQPKGQVVPSCYHHTAPPPPSSTGSCWQPCAQLLSSNVGKSQLVVSQKKVIGHEAFRGQMHWWEPALQYSGAVTSFCYLLLTCKYVQPFSSPTRLTHRSRSSSRALDNPLWQRWDLDQHKDSGQNNNFEGFFALISRSDFGNLVTPLLRAQHQDPFVFLGQQYLHLESRADISEDLVLG